MAAPSFPLRTCLVCGGTEFFSRTVYAEGAYGPDLLKGLGSLFRASKFMVVVCGHCGHVSFFADERSLAKLTSGEATGWQRLPTTNP